MSYKFAKIMFKIGWGLMIAGGVLFVPALIWIFTLPTPITDPKIVAVITNTLPLGLGGMIFIGGVLVYFALMDMASRNGNSESNK
jgi:hypothetical protein